jgi:hypothetical protein
MKLLTFRPTKTQYTWKQSNNETKKRFQRPQTTNKHG